MDCLWSTRSSKVNTLITSTYIIVEIWLPAWRQDVGCGNVENCQSEDCQACQATCHSTHLNCQDKQSCKNTLKGVFFVIVKNTKPTQVCQCSTRRFLSSTSPTRSPTTAPTRCARWLMEDFCSPTTLPSTSTARMLDTKRILPNLTTLPKVGAAA